MKLMQLAALLKIAFASRGLVHCRPIAPAAAPRAVIVLRRRRLKWPRQKNVLGPEHYVPKAK